MTDNSAQILSYNRSRDTLTEDQSDDTNGYTNKAFELPVGLENSLETSESKLEDGATVLEMSENREVRKAKDEVEKSERLLYSVEDNPPWYTCILLGLQVRYWRDLYVVRCDEN